MARSDFTSFRGEVFTLPGKVVRGEAKLKNATALPAAVLTVDSTDGYPATGTLIAGAQQLAYTGLTAATFTGVTGGAGTLSKGTELPVAVDLRGGTGVSLVFTAKRARGGAAVVTKSTALGGITTPAGAPGHAYKVAIAAGDTNGFTKAEELLWELRMTETNGDVTVVAYGVWRITLGAS